MFGERVPLDTARVGALVLCLGRASEALTRAVVSRVEGLALHDDKTGLANHRAFHADMRDALDEGPSGGRIVLVYADLKRAQDRQRHVGRT